jgi:hypothetical protein
MLTRILMAALLKIVKKLDVVAHIYNTALKKEGLEDCEFEDSLDYIVRLSQKNKTKKQGTNSQKGKQLTCPSIV